jgi:phosphodiesterase/alkaline phosphatase D-like protein
MKQIVPLRMISTNELIWARVRTAVKFVSPGIVTIERSSASEKATGHAVANVQGSHTDLTVTLDLRGLPPGTYFLATTHERDPASHFYPSSIK